MRKTRSIKLHERTKQKIRLEAELASEYRLRFAEGEKSSEIIDDLAAEYGRSSSTIYELLRPVKRLQEPIYPLA
ncbi:MAG: hypothetical protein RLP14_05950 [Owenweeksia sp.]